MKDKLMIRPLLNGNVRQRVDNGMLCLSDLANIYEVERLSNGWNDKRIDKFFNNSDEVEYIIELLDLQGVFINGNKLPFIEQVNNQGIIRALKSIGQYSTKGARDSKAVYCNPYIFIAVAQWLNPRFRAYVTIWATDQLILNRIEAGNNFNTLCDSISKHMLPKLSDNGKKFIFSNMAKLINKKVFGRHDYNLRQIASKEQLSELNKWETKMSTLIEVGYIKDYQGAKEYIDSI